MLTCMEHIYPNFKDKLKTIEATTFEVEYVNVFHMKELYRDIHEWIDLKGYKAIGNGQKEKLYMELMDSKGKKTFYAWWRIEKKINRYMKYWIMINMRTLGLSSIEVMHKGKKQKTNKGTVTFFCKAYLMLDYKDEWKNHWFLKLIDNWFVNRWYKKQRERHKKYLWYDMYELEDSIKQYLTLPTTRKMPVSWKAPKGLE